MTTYRIVRMFFAGAQFNRVIRRCLTLDEAQEHCQDPETSSSTCTDNNEQHTVWFDGYEEEGS